MSYDEARQEFLRGLAEYMKRSRLAQFTVKAKRFGAFLSWA